jgi:hypothetical protein
MSIRPRKIRKPPEYRNDVEKNQLAIRAVVAKRNQRLNASQKALRAAEMAARENRFTAQMKTTRPEFEAFGSGVRSVRQ